MVAESNLPHWRADSTTLRRLSRALLFAVVLGAFGAIGIAPSGAAAGAAAGAAPATDAGLGIGRTAETRIVGSASAASPRSAPAVDDAAAGLSIRVAPALSSTVTFTAPVAIAVEIENASGEALAAGVVRLVRSADRIDDTDGLDDWLASEGESAAIAGVAVAEAPSRTLSAGGATVVALTVPGDAFSDVADSPVLGIGAELLVDGIVVASGTGVFANTDVPATGSVAVALAAPLTVPTMAAATGLFAPEQLQNWTGPTGLLTRQLDALADRRVAIGLDPRILASIRVLGTSAPPTAIAWLERLAGLTNEVFPLGYADADLAVQAQLDLPAPLAPTSFIDVLDAGNFPADAGVDQGDAGGQADATAPPTDSPAPDPDALPTTDELLEWPYTRTDIAWPADDTVAAGDLAFFDAAGLTTAVLSPGNVEPAEGSTQATAIIDGSTALVADAGLTEPLRAASVASTDTESRAAVGRLLAQVAIDAGSTQTTVLATLGRGATAHSDRVAAAIDQLSGSPWSSLAGLSAAIGAPPEARVLIEQPEPDGRRVAVERMIAAEASVAAFATVLDDDNVLNGPTRRELLALLDVDWIGDPEAWSVVVGEWLAAQRSVLGAVSVVPSSPVNVLSRESPIPITVQNALPYPATVMVDVEPSNGRLIVEDQVEVTVGPLSRSNVNIPVTAGVGNGAVALSVSLASPTGVPVGGAVIIPANVQADWEGLGAAILATVVLLVFGIGVWRNIRRRRRERAAAASQATAPDSGVEAPATLVTNTTNTTSGTDTKNDRSGTETKNAASGTDATDAASGTDATDAASGAIATNASPHRPETTDSARD